jgi:rhodanese-related sulfurtransferase
MSQGGSAVVELEPAEVQARLARGEIVLVDVREPNEIAGERIAGAVAMPMSVFDPAALPGGDAGRIVFHCAGGKRSALAVARCRVAGVPARTHLRGGLAAWKAAGLPTER